MGKRKPTTFPQPRNHLLHRVGTSSGGSSFQKTTQLKHEILLIGQQS
jgi:hypothetical protein